MKKHLYTLPLILAACNALATDNFNNSAFFSTSDEKETSKYQYIEKKFITDIAKAKENVWSNIFTAIPAALATSSAFALAHLNNTNTIDANTIDTNTKSKDNKPFLKSLLNKQNIYITTFVISTAIIAGQIAQRQISKQAHYQAVADFFHNWDKNQNHTPEKLTAPFAMIAEQITLNGDDFITEHADEIVELIQFIITRHFDKRYEKLLQMNSYNALNDVKIFSDIFRSFLTGNKELAA
ncbi:hypothetical protein KBC04_02400 [Candidatus Babeliales bacterium]|nr:hypothetical protein [Candidatus Babeliales bacterium]MBP9843739.1 hypothetical protein [Candidatus Babeliales bacterium]